MRRIRVKAAKQCSCELDVVIPFILPLSTYPPHGNGFIVGCAEGCCKLKRRKVLATLEESVYRSPTLTGTNMFRTCPVRLGDGGDGFSCFEIGGQKGRIHISLHRSHAALTLMPALGERLLVVGFAAMTVLREFGLEGGDFTQDAASFRNCASQVFYEHSWRSESHTLAKAFLPASIAKMFQTDGVAHADQVIDQPVMQGLAVRCQPPGFRRQLPARLSVFLAVVPAQPLLALPFDASLFIIVVGVIGATLPIQLTLQTTLLAGIQAHFFGQLQQLHLSLPGKDGQRGWSQIQTNGVLTGAILGLEKGFAL